MSLRRKVGILKLKVESNDVELEEEEEVVEGAMIGRVLKVKRLG